MTYLIYDLLVAALLLVFIWRGYRKGFVLTLCGFLALFVAFIGASAISSTLAAPVSRIIQPAIEHNIQQVFLDHISQSGNSADASLADPANPLFPHDQSSAPPPADNGELSLQQALNLLKDSALYKGFADALQRAVNSGMVSASANAARSISDFIARQLAQMALFLIGFVLILILWFLFSHALDLAFRLPVLSGLNHWSGAILGLLQGSALVFILCWLMKDSLLSGQVIQSTYLLRFFCTTSPLALLL